MTDMGIPAASMIINQAKVTQAVNISVEKKVMDTAELQAAELLKMLPPTENLLDVYA